MDNDIAQFKDCHDCDVEKHQTLEVEGEEVEYAVYDKCEKHKVAEEL